LDLLNFGISILSLITGVASFYSLRKLKLEIIFSMGGSFILAGLVLLAIEYDLISGLAKFVMLSLIIAALASSFYIGVKRKWAYR
jgi:hypothetical protein